MKTFLIVHIIGAIIAFLIIYVATEISTPDFIKSLAKRTNQSYVKYDRLILLSLIWELTLLFFILAVIGEIIAALIKLLAKKGGK